MTEGNSRSMMLQSGFLKISSQFQLLGPIAFATCVRRYEWDPSSPAVAFLAVLDVALANPVTFLKLPEKTSSPVHDTSCKLEI